MKPLVEKWNHTSFILKIIIGLVIGGILGVLVPGITFIGLLGSLFVGALKALAPILVFFVVASSLCQAKQAQGGIIRNVIILYAVSTLLAALLAVLCSYVFPVGMVLTDVPAEAGAAPTNIAEIIENLFLEMVENPIKALADGNYIGILTFAIMFGLIFKKSSQQTKDLLDDISDGLSRAVAFVISLAPFGILGIAFTNMSQGGMETFIIYGKLICVLVGCMLVQALVINPMLVFFCIRQNPYPLVFYTLRRSAITAFFTRSSAANIPVNMQAAEDLGLNKDTYSVTLPLGSTVNMDGAAITITIMTMATVHTLGIPVDLPTALVLSVLASVAAAGTSGVAGGSLLLIPLACSLFGISDAVSMQVVGVGFMIGVIQDSMETALNSSCDLLMTAAAEFREWKKEGKKLPKIR